MLRDALTGIDSQKAHAAFNATVGAIADGARSKEADRERLLQYPALVTLQELVLLLFMQEGSELERRAANVASGIVVQVLVELAEVEALGAHVPATEII